MLTFLYLGKVPVIISILMFILDGFITAVIVEVVKSSKKFHK